MNYTIKSEKMTYTIDSLGAELNSAKANDGTEFIWQGDPKTWDSHSPMLFPVIGGLVDSKYTYKGKTYNMQFHGFLPYTEVDVIKQSDNRIVFGMSDNEQTLAVYPFPFNIEIDYEAVENALAVKVTVTNKGNDVMPFMFGGHPGFNLPMEDGLSFNDYKLDFGKNKIKLHRLMSPSFINHENEDFYLTNGILPIVEEEFLARATTIFKETAGSVTLYSDKGTKKVKVDYSDNFEYLSFWKKRGSPYLCIEPWSGIPSDGTKPENFDTRDSMIRLPAGESCTLEYKMTFYN